jgi:hypothetical protein
MSAKRTCARSALGTSGRRLYDSVTSKYELDEHELSLLLQACRTGDLCDTLQKVVDTEGVMIRKWHQDSGKATALGPHPALAELRQQRIVYARLLAALELPVGEEGAEKPKKQRNRSTQFDKLRSVPGA